MAMTTARALESDLRDAVTGEVRFDQGSRGAYSTDASNYRQVPIGVVVPRSVDDVLATVAVCREHGAPILGRGGGTSLAGQCCNAAVVLDFTKYLHDILELDPERRVARVRPGIYRDALDQAAAAHGLTFGPDPSTHDHCAIGGMIGNNACGAHAQMAGRMAENVDELEILTYDGERLRVGPTSERELERIIAAGGRRGQIYRGLLRIRDTYGDLIRQRFPRIPRRVSGYCLEQLLPENGFNVARGCCHDPRPRCWCCSGTRACTRPPTTCPRSWSTSRSRSKGSTTCSSTTCARRGCTPTTCPCSLRAEAG
jgi:hypothetical protein